MLRSDQNTVAGAWTDPRATASVAPPANPPAPASNSSRGWCRALDARLKHSYRTLRLRARDGTGRASPPRPSARVAACLWASGQPRVASRHGPTHMGGRPGLACNPLGAEGSSRAGIGRAGAPLSDKWVRAIRRRGPPGPGRYVLYVQGTAPRLPPSLRLTALNIVRCQSSPCPAPRSADARVPRARLRGCYLIFV